MGLPPEIGSFRAATKRVNDALRPSYEKEEERKKLAKVFEAIGEVGEAQGAFETLARFAEDHKSLHVWVGSRFDSIRQRVNDLAIISEGVSMVDNRRNLLRLIFDDVQELKTAIDSNAYHVREGLDAADKIINEMASESHSVQDMSGIIEYCERKGYELVKMVTDIGYRPNKPNVAVKELVQGAKRINCLGAFEILCLEQLGGQRRKLLTNYSKSTT